MLAELIPAQLAALYQTLVPYTLTQLYCPPFDNELSLQALVHSR